MENTCIKEKCLLWDLMDGKCPNYIESWWLPPGTINGQPILISDCAPKRTLMMIQDLSNRLTGVQKSQENLRNEVIWVEVVANILGKNSGVDLENMVNERKRLLNINNIKETLKIEDKEK